MLAFNEVGIVGAGAMGVGIAQIAAQAGAAVVLFDTREGAASGAIARLRETWARLVEKGKLTAAQADEAANRLRAAAGIDDLSGCDLVVEAIVEDLAAKRALFADLERVTAPDCVLVSNTSSLSVTAIAASCGRPERIAGFHFFNPVPLMRVVEVVTAARTAPAVADRLAAFAVQMGHRAVRCADSPGFIVNHAGRGFGTEALQIVYGEGAASVVDVDRALRDQVGFKLGPFELMDLTGLDVSQPVMESIFAQFHGEPRYRPSWALKQRLDAGLLGRKSGEGFYAYGDEAQTLPEQPVPAAAARPVWIVAAEADWRDSLTEIVRAAGWPVVGGAEPPDDALCLAAPLGYDATATALQLQIGPERLVLVDASFGLTKRRVIMAAPGSDPDFVAAAHALLATDGTPVTRIRDSVGFVAQRTVATIVNIACDIAQQQIATPEDIDDAVRLGLGYPQGPLALGDAVGPRRIFNILKVLQELTGDPRYRPSSWLRRRADLGLSLRTVETR